MTVFFDLAGVQGSSFQIGLVDGALFNTSGLTATRTYTFPDASGQILVGGPGVDLGNVQIIPRTSGGLKVAKVAAASGTNATNIKNAAGQLYGWFLYNHAAAERTIHIYDAAAAPTAGAGTVLFPLTLPAGGAANVNYEEGIALANGLGYTITTGAGDTDTGACTAGDITGVLFYF